MYNDNFRPTRLYMRKIENENKELKERINKAIEYMKKEFEEVGCCVSGSDLPYSYIDELLNILKGSDES